MDNNLEKLEIRISYLEDFLKQLNEVVLDQGKQITFLETEHKRLKDQIEELTDQLPGPESAKPPHY